jgi:aryl-alcohol dehydrogenase-like predicted oxidoreductase
MDYVNLGKTGVKVSRICLGCMSYGVPPAGMLRPGSNAWSLNEEQSQPFFRQALDAGINFFDTANVYSTGDSERVLGRFLKANSKREDVVIATKLNGVMRDGPNGGGLSRKEIFFEIDESLRRLGTDYVDLYQIHRWDRTTPIEETLEALNDVVRAGKARYLGASSMWAWQFSKALYTSEKHGWAKFVTMQPHYNLLYREEEREMLPLCLDQGVGVIPWSPLARGKLARAWDAETTKRSETDAFAKSLYAKTAEADKRVVDRLGELATARGVARAQIALAWLLTKPAVTAPIVGATKLHHLEDAVAAVSLKLTADEVASLEEPYVPHPVLGLS